MSRSRSDPVKDERSRLLAILLWVTLLVGLIMIVYHRIIVGMEFFSISSFLEILALIVVLGLILINRRSRPETVALGFVTVVTAGMVLEFFLTDGSSDPMGFLPYFIIPLVLANIFLSLPVAAFLTVLICQLIFTISIIRFGIDSLFEAGAYALFIILVSVLMMLLVRHVKDLEKKSLKRVALEKDKRLKEKGFLLDLIQHDIGNIHQSLLGNIEISRMAKGKKKDEMLDHSIISVRRAQRLTRNIKVINEAEKKGEALEPVELGCVIDKAVDKVRALRPEKGFDLKRSGDGRGRKVWGNEYLIDVFVNILDNALKWSEEDHPLIEMETGWIDDHVEVSIADRGPGMPEKLKRDLNRPDSVKLELDMGRTGLGLLVCSTVLGTIDGSIRAEDRPDGKRGTVMRLYLPAV